MTNNKFNTNTNNESTVGDLLSETFKVPLPEEILHLRKESTTKKRKFDATIGRDYSEDAKVRVKNDDPNDTVS